MTSNRRRLTVVFWLVLGRDYKSTETDVITTSFLVVTKNDQNATRVNNRFTIEE